MVYKLNEEQSIIACHSKVETEKINEIDKGRNEKGSIN